MTRNVGPADRIVRIVVGLGIGLLIYLGTLTGAAAVIAGIIAAALVLTGLFAMCPLYKLAGIDTTVQEQPYSTTDDRAGL